MAGLKHLKHLPAGFPDPKEPGRILRFQLIGLVVGIIIVYVSLSLFLTGRVF